MLWRYVKVQAWVLLCGGLVGPIFLAVYFATGQGGLLKWMLWMGLLITAADILIALALANYGAKSVAKTEVLGTRRPAGGRCRAGGRRRAGGRCRAGGRRRAGGRCRADDSRTVHGDTGAFHGPAAARVRDPARHRGDLRGGVHHQA